MQYFGEIKTKYDEIFLTQSYLYFNYENERISPKELKEKIKTLSLRKKNIIGTIFMYNPIVTPIENDSNKLLLEQNFDNFDEIIELKVENCITVFKQAIKDSCKGKLIEIKNLFNLIEKNINASNLLMKFNEDLEKYNSLQNTEFERDIMYTDSQNFIPSGKFVFFCWGDKINNKEFPYINEYAKKIYNNSIKLGKKVSFVYKKEKTEELSINFLQFSNPFENIKYKISISNAIKKSFEQFPPITMPYE